MRTIPRSAISQSLRTGASVACAVALTAIPGVVEAASGAGSAWGVLQAPLRYVYGLIVGIAPFSLTLAMLFFLYGLARFVGVVGEDEKAIPDGKRMMVWGVIGMSVFALAWGLVSLLNRIFDILPIGPPQTVTAVYTDRELTFQNLIQDSLLPIGELTVSILVALVILVFLFSVSKFMLALARGDEDGIATGKKLLVWGIVALFVTTSFWGIMSVLATIAGFTDTHYVSILFPQFKTAP